MIRQLLYQSITDNTFPLHFKHATIQPRLIKLNINYNILSNYRHISHSIAIAKILKKILYRQINNYLLTNNLLDKHQSGYRHCTETVLLCVYNN